MSRPDILSRAGRAELAAFLADAPLLASDFDGVLAPIVAVREAARPRSTTHHLLREVAERFPCVVISGRPLADLAPRLHGIPLRMIFGNFGWEPSADGGKPPQVIAEWVAELEARLPPDIRVFIEDKRYSVAIHYRQAPDQTRARRIIARAVQHLHDVRVLDGTKAVTLLPLSGPDKGSTLQAARKRLHCERVVFIGDDDTDEDAFRSAPPDRMLSIRVGRALKTEARYRLADQEAIDTLLQEILVMSRRGSEPRERRAARLW
jgi:trehalose 6-phosphate phosphatase